MKKTFSYLFSDLVVEGDITPDRYYELIHTGMNTDPRYGDFKFTRQQLEEMAKNFNEGVRGVEVAVDINHDPEKKAYAWIKPGSMKVEPSQNLAGQYSLFAQLYRFTPEGEKLVKEGAYRYFSLEIQYKYERMINGIKKIFNNVIVGLALTNSPVIKELAPTYAEQHTTNYSDSMEMFQIFLDLLAAQEYVTSDQKEALQQMAGKLTPEEVSAVQEQMDSVMAMPEEMSTQQDPAKDANANDTAKNSEEAPAQKEGEEAEKDAESDANEGEQSEAEKPEEKTDAALSENKQLSELQNQVATLMSERNQLLAEKKEKMLSEKANSLVLSESRKVGFRAEKIEEVKSFLATLSEEQATQFDKLVGEVISVDFSERGISGSKTASSDVDSLARQIAKDEKISMSAALEKAYRKLGQWKAE